MVELRRRARALQQTSYTYPLALRLQSSVKARVFCFQTRILVGCGAKLLRVESTLPKQSRTRTCSGFCGTAVKRDPLFFVYLANEAKIQRHHKRRMAISTAMRRTIQEDTLSRNLIKKDTEESRDKETVKNSSRCPNRISHVRVHKSSGLSVVEEGEVF